MTSSDRLGQLATALFANKDLSRLAPAGSGLSSVNSFLTAPLGEQEIKVQRFEQLDNWSEVDCLSKHCWMRIHIFGNTSGLVGMATAAMIDPDMDPDFDVPRWNREKDMLIMLASGSNPMQLAARLFGTEAAPSLADMMSGALGPMLDLARSIEKHEFIARLEQAARSRNRSRLVVHIRGEEPRLQTLTKGFGFTLTKTSDGHILEKPVELDDVN